MSVTIFADKREPAVISHLTAQSCKLEPLQMTVGDFAIADESRIYAIVERKTIADLSASIKDGRMANKDKLKSLHLQSGCDVIFIIEGDWAAVERSKAKKTCGIYTKSLLTSVSNLQTVHKFLVYVTRDQSHTAAKLINLAESYAEARPERIAVESVTTLLNYQYSRDPVVIVSNMFLSLPGITTANLSLLYDITFCKLLAKYDGYAPSFGEVFTLPDRTIRALTSLSDFLFWKAVSQIPNVTETHIKALSPAFGYKDFDELTSHTEAKMVLALGQKTSSIPATIALYAGKYKLTTKTA